MKKGLVLMLLLVSVEASAQQDHLTYPDKLTICSAANDCIVVQKADNGFVGLIDGGTKPAWNFEYNDFRLEHLRLTGTSTDTDSEGRHQVVVVDGKPRIARYWITHCKARYTVGHKSTSRKVAVTWQPPHNIPRIGH